MQVLQRISRFGAQNNQDLPPTPTLKKKATSVFVPISRSQKIKQRNFLYPSSTHKKIVLVSNVHGTGFKHTDYSLCPKDIKINGMVNELNTKCLKQWQNNRKFFHKNPFQKLNILTNLTIFALIILCTFLAFFDELSENNNLTIVLYLLTTILFSSLIISLKVYYTNIQHFDSDKLMIRAIKQKLNEFNKKQNETTNNRPRFSWNCHKQCLWISLDIKFRQYVQQQN